MTRAPGIACLPVALGLVLASAAGIAGAAEDRIERVVVLAERVCLPSFPDFMAVPAMARAEGMDTVTVEDSEIHVDPDGANSIVVVPAESVMGLRVTAPQCVVSAYEVPYPALVERIGRRGTALTFDGQRMEEGPIETDDFGEITRSFSLPGGPEVHVLLFELKDDHAVGLGLSSESYW